MLSRLFPVESHHLYKGHEASEAGAVSERREERERRETHASLSRQTGFKGVASLESENRTHTAAAVLESAWSAPLAAYRTNMGGF